MTNLEALSNNELLNKYAEAIENEVLAEEELVEAETGDEEETASLFQELLRRLEGRK